MATYIIKRILLMIPTMLLISIIIFGVLNLAPGKPGASSGGSDGMQNSQSAEARESYRIFKEQFNYDKPAMWNSRFSLTDDEVTHHIVVLADAALPICAEGKAGPECLTSDQRPGSGSIIRAQDEIEDWGQYVVPQLLKIADTHKRLDVRSTAINRLSVNAKRRLINEYGRNQTPEERATNRDIDAENQLLQSWTASTDADKATLDTLVNDKWKPWFAKHAERWDWSFSDKVGIFFFDTRFAKYWRNLAHLDFGVSHVDKRPVIQTIMQKVPYTLTMNLLAVLFAYFISVPLGVWSAYRQNTTMDRIVTVLLFVLYSLPSFFVAVILLEWFASGDPFGWFPTGGFVGRFPTWYGEAPNTTAQMTTLEYLLSVAYHMVLPVFCMTYGALASLSRYARTGILDVIRADYIRTARAKGLSEPMVIVKHAVRNGMIPVLTLLGTMLPALIGGSVVIEYVFNIPGMGLYMFESIFALDYNAIMAVLLISTVLTLVGLLISDLSYAVVDPRISFD